MKKMIKSLLAFVIALTTLFSAASPVAAWSFGSTDTNNQNLVPSSDVAISERYHIIENGYKGKYDLQEGIFGHQSSQQVNKNAVYFYSDGYFADAPEIYNSSLSSMSFALANSAFNVKQTNFDLNLISGSYSNLFRHAKLLMSDLGFKDKDIFVNDSLSSRPTDESIGMIMSAKEISLDGSNYILIPIAVRGGDYEAEWASNVTLGTSGESYGFSNSAAKVVEQVQSYINTSTSFDISSALKDGKVKFWVVGYSRGGAVANITAKRLTDIYGKSGNDIYSYCFEAPAGGVDADEINENWTYNGFYKNIHNIINPGDIVPKIPPKQLGFKRYGIDHYIPGTDAGEIVISTYTTPTGITVTTRADNIPLTVGSDDYNERRESMVSYLAAIDSNIEFSDEFSLAKFNLLNILQGGEIQFESIETENEVTASEWLDTFIEDLLTRTANGAYSGGILLDGGYNNDYRNFYTSHSLFAGKKLVTIEVAVQQILKLAFTHYYNEEFLDSMLYRAIALLNDRVTLIDMSLNVIQRWDKLPKQRQAKYLDKIWNYLNSDMTYEDGSDVKKITDFVDPSEHKLIKDSVYSLSYFLFLWVAKDIKASPSIDGVNATQVHIITLIANIKTLMQGHYPEICFAWLNTYDENYSLTNSKYAGTEINLINDESNTPPDVNFEIDVQDGTSTIYLSSIINSQAGVDQYSENNGSAIYYAIFENGIMSEDWQLYGSPIVIDTVQSTEYTVKVFATRFEETSAIIEITDEEIRTPQKAPDKIEDEEPIEIHDPTPTPPTPRNNLLPIIIAIVGASLIVIIIIFIVKNKRK